MDYKEEIKIDKNYLNLLRNLIHTKLGIYISQEKTFLLESKLAKLLRKTKYDNIREFYEDLKKGNQEGLEELIRYITTTHTFFFREKSHLEILKNDIKSKNINHPYIWCAASSTGEEVYSIIITLLENHIQHFLIIATDINRDVLRHLKKGIYQEERMKEVGKNILSKYFRETKPEIEKKYQDNSKLYKVKDYLKKFLIIKKINLVEKLKFEKKFDYIFCRNVMIYFDKETQKKVVLNLLNNLKDNGFLFLGHSETLINMNYNMKQVHSSVYKFE